MNPKACAGEVLLAQRGFRPGLGSAECLGGDSYRPTLALRVVGSFPGPSQKERAATFAATHLTRHYAHDRY